MTENEHAPRSRAKQEIDFPFVLLCFLLIVVGILIYVGYDYLSDDFTTQTTALSEATDELASEEAEAATALAEEEEPLEEAPEPAIAASKAQAPVAKTPTASVKKMALTETAEKREAAVKAAAPVSAGKTITHQVQSGETFRSIAKRYNLSSEALKALNEQIEDEAEDLKAGVTKLNVRVKAVHTVGPGDILRKVATKYGVDKTLIMAANGKTRDYTARGEILIIPLP